MVFKFQIPCRLTLLTVLAVVLLIGCSSSGDNSSPVVPDEVISTPEISGNADISNTTSGNNHFLLGYNIITIDTTDPDDIKAEMVPVRATSMHLNILKLLETGFCTDCFKLVGFNFPEPGVLDVDIMITHPFDALNLTIFDVRGIIMFNGSHLFPASGLTMSDSSMGDGELLNSEGFTRLYNGSTLGMAGDFFTYFPGKLSTPDIPDADLNGFIRHITDHPANTRNVLFPADSVTQTYSLALPTGEFVLGYAVDASWDLPDVDPVKNPITDFPITANCIEPWKIEVSGISIYGDGSTTLSIYVYDWEGKDTIASLIVECPELFSGQVSASYLQDGPGYTRYEAVISNDNGAPAGTYKVLITAEANENATSPDWIDLTTYIVHNIDVALPIGSGDLIWAKSTGGDQGYPEGRGITTLSDNSTVVTGTFGSSAIFGEGEPNETILVTDNSTDIFIARYYSDGSLAWAKRAGGDSHPNHNIGLAITALSDNSTVVTGNFWGVAIFGEGEPNETVLVPGNSDIFIARYNPDGTLAWAKRAGGPTLDWGYGITTLSDNSTVVTGVFYDSATFGEGEPNETVLFADGGSDIFMARYNPDGTLAWAKRAGGPDRDDGYGITTLSDNSTAVIGNFSESATFGEGELNETVLVSDGDWDIFIARYNSDGTLAWAKRVGGASGESGHGITTLSDNSTVVTGFFDESITFGEGEPNETVLAPDGHSNIFIARYNPDGTLAWAKLTGGTPYGLCIGITTLSDNSTAATGQFKGIATFGQGEPNETVLDSDWDSNIFIARYNPDGSLAWAKYAGGSDDFNPFGITALNDNSTVVTGSMNGETIFGEGEQNETVMFNPWTQDMFIARFAP